MSEEYEMAIHNGKDLIKIFGFCEGSIGYYKMYSMINLIEKQQNQIKKLNIENQKLFEEVIEVTKERDELKEKNNNQRWLIRQLDKENIIPDIDGKILDYISKDKIKDKMNEIMNYTFSSSKERHCQNYAYDRLKELLGEE